MSAKQQMVEIENLGPVPQDLPGIGRVSPGGFAKVPAHAAPGLTRGGVWRLRETKAASAETPVSAWPVGPVSEEKENV